MAPEYISKPFMAPKYLSKPFMAPKYKLLDNKSFMQNYLKI